MRGWKLFQLGIRIGVYGLLNSQYNNKWKRKTPERSGWISCPSQGRTLMPNRPKLCTSMMVIFWRVIFVVTHVMMYRSGHRQSQKAPELITNAVPSILKSHPPHFETRVSDPSLQHQQVRCITFTILCLTSRTTVTSRSFSGWDKV